MPSGAKRRKAAKKKEAILAWNGEVTESDGGENSSPAFQDLEPQQNPFNKDVAMENMKDGNRSISNGEGDLDPSAETESFAKEIVRVKDAVQVAESTAVVLKNVKSVCSTAAGSKSKKNEEKVNPSETFTDFKETNDKKLPLSKSNSSQLSNKIAGEQLLKSNISISNIKWHARSSDDVQQSAEKEPRGQLPKPHGQVVVDCWSCLLAHADKAVERSSALQNGLIFR